ncbi:MAG: hypothetical protein ACLFR6_00985 [Salinarchaeum sp.]
MTAANRKHPNPAVRCRGNLRPSGRRGCQTDIAPFSPTDIDKYVARSLAYFRDEPYEGQSQELFTPGAIEDIYDRTDGVPREVRMECRDLFTRAAFVWYRTGQSIDRVQVTPELKYQRFGMER